MATKYQVHSIWQSGADVHNDRDKIPEFNQRFLALVNSKLQELLTDEWEVISIEYNLTSLDGGWLAKEAFFYTVRYE